MSDALNIPEIVATVDIVKEIGRFVALKRRGNEWLGPCPFHADHNPSFAVIPNLGPHGRFKCFPCGAAGDVVDFVRKIKNWGYAEACEYLAGGRKITSEERAQIQRNSQTRAKLRAPISADADTKHNAASAIWRGTVPLKSTLGEKYLNQRGEVHASTVEDLRFHPACPMGGGMKLPAMVAQFRDIYTNASCGIHRTALNPDATKHAAGKKMLGRVSGACIKLCADEDVTTGLSIAEGIENALTLISRGWRPVWAAGSAGAISTFPVLDGIECLTIFADADDSGVGLTAARACAAHWRAAGREVIVRVPPTGRDWNDVAVECAA